MTGDDHIALAGALVLAFLAIREARRYFRTLPDYCVTPLVPEVRPEPYAEHADQAIAQGNSWTPPRDPDPIAAIYEDWAAEMKAAREAEDRLMALEVMATIDAPCDPEVAE